MINNFHFFSCIQAVIQYNKLSMVETSCKKLLLITEPILTGLLHELTADYSKFHPMHAVMLLYKFNIKTFDPAAFLNFY